MPLPKFRNRFFVVSGDILRRVGLSRLFVNPRKAGFPRLFVNPRKAGFTLMEVMIAIVILSLSTITLMGLFSAITRRNIVDNQKIQAVLAAREVLAAAEINISNIAPGKIEGTPDKVRDELLGKKSGDAPPPAGSQLPLQAVLTTTELPIPGDPTPVLYRLELRVGWGSATGESIVVNYFVPIN